MTVMWENQQFGWLFCGYNSGKGCWCIRTHPEDSLPHPLKVRHSSAEELGCRAFLSSLPLCYNPPLLLLSVLPASTFSFPTPTPSIAFHPYCAPDPGLSLQKPTPQKISCVCAVDWNTWAGLLSAKINILHIFLRPLRVSRCTLVQCTRAPWLIESSWQCFGGLRETLWNKRRVVLMSDYCKCRGSFYALAVPRGQKGSRFSTFQQPSAVMYGDVFVSAT